MTTDRTPMSDKAFYSYMYPLQNRRFYLALVFAVILFPLVAAGLIAGTIFLIEPAAAVRSWISTRIFFANMLGNSILVSTENFPRINTIAEEVKTKLGYTKPIYIFVYEQGDFNASMKHFFFRRAIFLNSELLQNGVTDIEVRWIVGRFVGYMRTRQQAGMLGWIIRAAEHLVVCNIFILPYERAMVHTGDRLALAEIDGELASAISAMQKLLVGRELGYSVNPQGLIAQQRKVKGSFFAFLARMWTAFPHMTARYVDLILFAKAFFPEAYKVSRGCEPGPSGRPCSTGLVAGDEACRRPTRYPGRRNGRGRAQLRWLCCSWRSSFGTTRHTIRARRHSYRPRYAGVRSARAG